MPSETAKKDKSYSLLIFDWDGTLMDSSGVIVKCVQLAASDLGLPDIDANTIRRGIGLGFMEQLYRLYDVSIMDAEAFSSRYHHHYLQNNHDTRPPLFEGALETLQHLKKRGYQLAVATSMGRARLDDTLGFYELNDLFDSTRTADQTASKPDPLMLYELMEELGVPVEQCIMVGDTEYDMQLAKNAKMDRLAVGYGVHDPQELLALEPIACVDDIMQLLDIFQ